MNNDYRVVAIALQVRARYFIIDGTVKTECQYRAIVIEVPVVETNLVILPSKKYFPP
jgi:hypothetical protein